MGQGIIGYGKRTGSTKHRVIKTMRILSSVLAILTYSLVFSQMEKEDKGFADYRRDTFLCANFCMAIFSILRMVVDEVFRDLWENDKWIKILDFGNHLLIGVPLVSSGILYAKWIYFLEMDICQKYLMLIQYSDSLPPWALEMLHNVGIKISCVCLYEAMIKRVIAMTFGLANGGFCILIAFLILLH